MLSYYPPMSGEEDTTPQAPGTRVMLCDVDRHGNLVNCRPYNQASAHGDDINPNTQICDVDRRGNLVNCRPYYPQSSPHGWEFDGSSGFGGVGSEFGAGRGGGSFAAPRTMTVPSSASRIDAHLEAARSVDAPLTRLAPQAAAARQNVFTPPNTTRQFSNTQRRSYGRMFRGRGYGYAGLGLAPRPWNWDPYYADDVYFPYDVDATYDPDAFDDDPNFNGDIMNEARHMVASHKPVVGAVTLGALGAYAAGGPGAVIGGVAGYFAGKMLR
jgi:hypothetical protein